MTHAAEVLRCLEARERTGIPVALVAAHPDDETIGAGASLALFERLLLVHVTDGAPADLADARRAGFATRAAYASRRRQELRAALAAGGVSAELLELGVGDQAASLDMAALARRLRGILAQRGVRVVITHPYEGGHPDHDATAFAVQAAGGAERIEMASYYAGPAGMATGAFLTGGDVVTVELRPDERARKAAMLACFATQSATLAPFGCEREVFRVAPSYDFGAPPHPGTLHYERYDWGMTGARWRALAAHICAG